MLTGSNGGSSLFFGFEHDVRAVDGPSGWLRGLCAELPPRSYVPKPRSDPTGVPDFPAGRAIKRALGDQAVRPVGCRRVRGTGLTAGSVGALRACLWPGNEDRQLAGDGLLFAPRSSSRE